MSSSIAIITTDDSPRLRYVAHVVFGLYFKVEYKIAMTPDEVIEGTAIIDYSHEASTQFGFKIPISGFLSEKGITSPRPQVSDRDEISVLFPDTHRNGFGFDVFAAIFWCLSRYEEYGPFEPDEHGRFQPKDSLAYKEGFLQLPVVDIWINLLRKELLEHYPQLKLAKQEFSFIPTIDVDQAYAYKGKGVLRTGGSIIRDILKGSQDFTRRWQVMKNRKEDPFFTFDFLEEQFEKQAISPIFFVQVGKHGTFDKNLLPDGKLMRQLIAKLSKYKVGLHPSYRSFDEPELLVWEKKQLEEVLQRPVRMSRQHFLRLDFPGTYRRLIEAGIEADYTMGHASTTGFRAGTVQPFPFYDLEQEMQRELMIYPFCIMEVTLRHYLKLSPTDADKRITDLMQQTRKVGGTFIPIWHNETLYDQDIWQG